MCTFTKPLMSPSTRQKICFTQKCSDFDSPDRERRQWGATMWRKRLLHWVYLSDQWKVSGRGCGLFAQELSTLIKWITGSRIFIVIVIHSQVQFGTPLAAIKRDIKIKKEDETHETASVLSHRRLLTRHSHTGTFRPQIILPSQFFRLLITCTANFPSFGNPHVTMWRAGRGDVSWARCEGHHTSWKAQTSHVTLKMFKINYYIMMCR